MKLLSTLTLLLIGINLASAETTPSISVYRSPTCQCCEKWIDHLKQNNFSVDDHVTSELDELKRKYQISAELASCHTAFVGGYIIEGHVPASDIKTLLTTNLPLAGISAPGMPVGSPGMEMGGKKDAYDVISFDKYGHTEVFIHHPGSP